VFTHTTMISNTAGG